MTFHGSTRFGSGAPARLRRYAKTRPPVILPGSAWLYWVAVVGAASAAGGVVVFGASGAEPWERFGVLTLAASLAQLSAVQISRNRVFHPAIVFVVVAAIALPPELLILMCVVQHLPDWLRHRYAWYIQMFNIANYVLAGLAAAGIYTLVHTFPTSIAVPAAGIAAAAAFVLVNRIVLVVMLRLGRGQPLAETGLFAREDVALEFVLALMGVPFVYLWHADARIAPLALAPLLLIQYTQRNASRLEVASATIVDQNQALEEANRLLIERSTASLEALSATVDARDEYTAGHSRRVRDISLAVGREMGLSDQDLEALGQAALLHDIGKIGIPDAILLKPDRLTRTEWLVMKNHAEEGAQIIERLGFLAEIVPAIRHHHERFDGQGYPAGLSGDAIPRSARIIHVADSIDAMTSDRVYRTALPSEVLISKLRAGAGTDFCPECVAAACTVLDARARTQVALPAFSALSSVA